MLRAEYFSTAIVYSIISSFSEKTNARLRYLEEPLDCFSTMADGCFLRGHGLNLYHLQYECLELPSIMMLP